MLVTISDRTNNNKISVTLGDVTKLSLSNSTYWPLRGMQTRELLLVSILSLIGQAHKSLRYNLVILENLIMSSSQYHLILSLSDIPASCYVRYVLISSSLLPAGYVLGTGGETKTVFKVIFSLLKILNKYRETCSDRHQ